MDKEKIEVDLEADFTGYSEKKNDQAVDLGSKSKTLKSNVIFLTQPKPKIVFQAQNTRKR